MNRTGLTMDIKTLLLVFISTVTCGCSTAASTTFGIANFDGDGHLLLVVPQELPSTGALQVQFPDARSNAQCCKPLRARAFKPVKNGPIAANLLRADSTFVYQADVPAEWADMPFIGIAVVGEVRSMKSEQDRLEVLTVTGAQREVKLCTSREGVHLTDQASSDRMATHLYLGLGYDIESPTCAASVISRGR